MCKVSSYKPGSKADIRFRGGGAKPGRQSWFYLLKCPDGFDFAARFEWPGETNRAWTWHCWPGAHTEGELALVTTVAPVNTEKQTATYSRTEFLSYFYPNIRRGLIEARPLMTSFQWLVKARPDLRNFSGYDLLWVDLHCDAGLVELWLALLYYGNISRVRTYDV